LYPNTAMHGKILHSSTFNGLLKISTRHWAADYLHKNTQYTQSFPRKRFKKYRIAYKWYVYYLLCRDIVPNCRWRPFGSSNFASALLIILSWSRFSRSKETFCNSSKLEFWVSLCPSWKFACSKSATKSLCSFVSRESFPL